MKFPYEVKLKSPTIKTDAKRIASKVIEMQKKLQKMHEENNELRLALWKTVGEDEAIDLNRFTYAYDHENRSFNCTGTLAEDDTNLGLDDVLKLLH